MGVGTPVENPWHDDDGVEHGGVLYDNSMKPFNIRPFNCGSFNTSQKPILKRCIVTIRVRDVSRLDLVNLFVEKNPMNKYKIRNADEFNIPSSQIRQPSNTIIIIEQVHG